MTPAERLDQLRSLIAHHNERYYTHDAPEISDADYDQLVREVAQLEAEHPELVDAGSPTQLVGAGVVERGVLAGRPPGADDQPRQRDGRRRAGCVGRAAWPAVSAASPPGSCAS